MCTGSQCKAEDKAENAAVLKAHACFTGIDQSFL